MNLNEGLLEFELQRPNAEPIKCSIDLMVLSLACNEVVQTHQLAIRPDGCYQSTAEFLLDLTAKLQKFVTFSEQAQLTPTMALTLWVEGGARESEQKKNTAENPSSLTGTESTPSS